jgi:hypothetical protein
LVRVRGVCRASAHGTIRGAVISVVIPDAEGEPESPEVPAFAGTTEW